MTAVSVTAIHEDKSFFGHPRGLAYLSFTEAWERFSYYGMQTLLVLYMVHQLLLPGHVEHVAGFAWLRGVLAHGHAMSDQQIASAVFGLYTALVYLTPFFGGLLADWVLGRTATVILGACLMALGHFLMAFDVSFLVALLCLMLGSGCFKGNIATQVGGLYSTEDLRRADAFQIFYLGINAGVIIAPLVTGTLAEKVAWHYGFGAAGVGMLVSLVIYLSGRKYLPPDQPRGARKAEAGPAHPPMTGRDWATFGLLILLLPVLSASIVGNNEIFNAYLVWAERKADLRVFGQPILTEWLVSVDAIVSVATLVGMVVFWRAWKTRFTEPDELGKMAIGCLFGAAGVACLALGTIVAGGQKVGFGWLVLFHLLNDIGFANVLPVGLALYARAAPRAIAGSVVGLYYLHLFAGNLFVGWLGGLLEKMPAVQFWLIHAALVGGAGVVFFLVKAVFGRLLAGEPAEPDFVTADAQEAP